MKARSRSIHLSVHIHKDPAAMAERAAHILAAACEEAVAERGVFRIALSGGQTPIPLFRLLAASDWADRLTLTLPVINNSRCCMFLVTGKEKHQVLGQVLDLLAEPTLPAQMVRPSVGDLIWVVDEAAATGQD